MTISTVTKRNGDVVPFDVTKFNRWAEYAAEVGGNWSEIAIETYKALNEGMSTQDIHQTMTDVCVNKATLEHSRIASRLEFATIRKNMQYVFGLDDRASIKDILQAYEDFDVWDSDYIPPYNPVWEDWYTELKQTRLEYWQVKQWTDKYACKVDEVVVETPHLGYFGISLALFGDTDKARKYMLALVQGKVNLPTPALNGLRSGDWDTISCCVISGGDTTKSIGVANHIAYEMTAKKAGIGIELTTRTKGDKVKNGRVEHLGLHPLYKQINGNVKALTQITRGGNATITVQAINPEVMDVFQWKSPLTDFETRIDKLDYSFAYNRAFVDAVMKDTDWYMFSYGDAPELYKSFYKDDTEVFNKQVAKLLKKGVKHKVLKAREILKKFLTIRQETGRVYDIDVTRANQHTPFEDTIVQSNLCVAPETKILTTNGYEVISELEGEEVTVWNGQEWSDTVVRKTGENQKLLTVKTNAGFELTCTPYHKFYIACRHPTSGNRWVIEKRAHELQVGDKLIKSDFPVIEGSEVLLHSYANGFYSGDGCLTPAGKRIYLYGEKRKLKPYFGDIFRNWSVQDNQDREYGHSDYLKDKFFVPNSDFNVESRIKWFEGLCDSDGTIARNGNTQSIQVGSIEQGFLQDIQMMLQTLGVSSKVTASTEAGERLMPLNDGSGEMGLFYCQQAYRLLIGQTGINHLQALGFNPKRLVITDHKPNRECTQFVKITEVVDEGRVDDTYCFTESKRGMGVFNGILTGQCMEIQLPTKPYVSMDDLLSNNSKGETAFCSLSGIVVGKVSDEEYEEIAELVLEAIDIMIDRAPMMTKAMKKDILERRSVGVGIVGLAVDLYNNNLDFDGSNASVERVAYVAERHYYYLLKASQKLAETSGISVKGIKQDWLPIDTAVNKPQLNFDWEALRGKPRKHSVLVAHMPTESSSLNY